MTAFMTTVAPMGWTLGRWVQVGEHVWEEQKADGSSHQFEVVYGPPTPGSSTLRLRHAGGTEVMLVGGTVQVFCQGHYMGEYLGYWEGEPQGPPPPVPGAPPMAYPMAADEGFQKCAPSPQRGMSKTSQVQQQVEASGSAPGVAPPKKRASQIAASPANQRLAAAAKRKPQKPTNLNASAETGASLIEAAKAGDSKKLQMLLSTGADPDAFGAEGPEAGTAIFYAAEGGYSQACQVLIEAFANVNIPAGGTTPMQAAFQKGHKGILQLLFGATFNTLDTAVTQSNAKVLGQLPGGDDIGYGDDDELPAGAAEELKMATRKLADFGKPGKEKEAESISEDLRLPSQNEASRAREAAVKGALQTIKESTGKPGEHPRAQSPKGK